MKHKLLFMLLIASMVFGMMGGTVMAASEASEPLISATADMEDAWNPVPSNWGSGFYPTVPNSPTEPQHGGNTPNTITNAMKQRSFFAYPVPFTKDKTGIADDAEFNAMAAKLGLSEEELSSNGILGHSSTALALKTVPDAEAIQQTQTVTSGTTTKTNTFANSQPYVMMLQDLGYFRTIDSSKKLRLGFDVYKPADGGTLALELKISSTWATANITSTTFKQNGSYALNAGEWNRIDMLLDCSTNTGNLYINNKLVAENYKPVSSVSSITNTSCRILAVPRTNATTTAYIDNFTTEYIDSITLPSIEVVSNNAAVTVDNGAYTVTCDAAASLTVGDVLNAVSSGDYTAVIQKADYSEAAAGDALESGMKLVVTANNMTIKYDIETNDAYPDIFDGTNFAKYESKNTLFFAEGKTVADLKAAAGSAAVTVIGANGAADDSAILADCAKAVINSYYGTLTPLEYSLAVLDTTRVNIGIDNMSNGGVDITNSFKPNCLPSSTFRNATYSSGYGIGGRDVSDASFSVVSKTKSKDQPFFDRTGLSVGTDKVLVFEYSYFNVGRSKIAYRIKDKTPTFITAFDAGLVVYADHVGTTAMEPVENNKWYRVTGVIDLKNKKEYAYLNGRLFYSADITYNGISQVGMSFYNETLDGTPIYIDDMEIFTSSVGYTPAAFTSDFASDTFTIADGMLLLTEQGTTAGDILEGVTYGGAGEILGVYADSAAKVKRASGEAVTSGDVIIARDGQLFNYMTITAPVGVDSDVYTVKENTIENIPYDTAVDTFKSNISYISSLATGVILRGGEEITSGAVASGDILRVTAVGAVKDYTLNVKGAITSAKYTVNETAKTIANVTYGIPAADLVKNLTAGAATVTLSVTRGGEAATGAVQAGDTVVASSSVSGDVSYTVTGIGNYNYVTADFEDFAGKKAYKQSDSDKPNGFAGYSWGDRDVVETEESCYIEGTTVEGREGTVLHLYSNPLAPEEGKDPSVQSLVHKSGIKLYDGATVEFDIMTPDYNNGKLINLKGTNASGKEDFIHELFTFNSDGDMTVLGGAVNLGHYELNKWYHLAIELDLNNRVVTVWLNGAKAAEDVKLSPAVRLYSDITHYRIQNRMNVGKISELYVDNFKIYNNWYGSYDPSGISTEIDGADGSVKVMNGINSTIILPEGMSVEELLLNGYLNEDVLGAAAFYDENGTPVDEDFNTVKYITVTSADGVENTYTIRNGAMSVVYSNPNGGYNDVILYADSDVNVYYASGKQAADTVKAVVAVYERNTNRLIGVKAADINMTVPEGALYSEGTAKLSMSDIPAYVDVDYSKTKVFVVNDLNTVEPLTENIFNMLTKGTYVRKS